MNQQSPSLNSPQARKATFDEMKAEAVSRMKSIGIKQEYIDAFAREDGYEISFFHIVEKTVECMSDKEEDPIIELEWGHTKLVWAVIHEHDFVEGEEWNYYYHLFVTNDPDNWDAERKELLDMKPTVYLASIPEEYCRKQDSFPVVKITVNDGILSLTI